MSFGQFAIDVPLQFWVTGSVTACVVVARRIVATDCGRPFSFGQADISKAAAPATCGAAMLVPSITVYELVGNDE